MGIDRAALQTAALKSLVLTETFIPDVDFPEKREKALRKLSTKILLRCRFRMVGNAIKPATRSGGGLIDSLSIVAGSIEKLFSARRHIVHGTQAKKTRQRCSTFMDRRGANPVLSAAPKNRTGARLNDSKYFVIEGDDYDSAFVESARNSFIPARIIDRK